MVFFKRDDIRFTVSLTVALDDASLTSSIADFFNLPSSSSVSFDSSETTEVSPLGFNSADVLASEPSAQRLFVEFRDRRGDDAAWAKGEADPAKEAKALEVACR